MAGTATETDAALALAEAVAAIAAEFSDAGHAIAIRHGLPSPAAVGVLELLDASPQPLPPSEIAQKLGVSRPTVTGIIGTLEARGFLAIAADANDGRMRRIAITGAGRDRLAAVLPELREREKTLFARLDANERRTLRTLLGRLLGPATMPPPLAADIHAAGVSPQTPLSVAACWPDGRIEVFAQGAWPDGTPVTADHRFYAASLAKQVTGAAVALLAKSGRLSPDAPVAQTLGGLPPWSRAVTVRQLLHHTSGLPAAGVLEDAFGPRPWSNDTVMAALQQLRHLDTPPGEAYAYSNAGYILLGRIVEAVTETSFARFCAKDLFAPLGLTGIAFTDDFASFPQAAGMGAKLPRSTGDGGLWTTAAAFAQWLDHQNRDPLGIAGLVQQPTRLNDGTAVPYGWGIGLREFRGAPLILHGGSFTGAVARALRSPSLKISVVALAANEREDRLAAVTDIVRTRLAG